MEAPSAPLLTVPLFPLSSAVLFPEVCSSFFIFEPRYRAMLAEVLDGPGLLGIPQIVPGFEGSAAGTPPLCRILGVGRVTNYVTEADGTSSIDVLGLHRARLVEELPSPVFRRGRVQVLSDGDEDTANLEELRENISAAVVSALNKRGAEKLGESLLLLIQNKSLSFTHVLHSLVSVLVANRVARQSLLEVSGLRLRTKLFVSSLMEIPEQEP
jgi:Lon protease-like protein